MAFRELPATIDNMLRYLVKTYDFLTACGYCFTILPLIKLGRIDVNDNHISKISGSNTKRS